jgi:hypothetical protein
VREDSVSGGFFWQGNDLEVVGISGYLRNGYIYIYSNEIQENGSPNLPVLKIHRYSYQPTG